MALYGPVSIRTLRYHCGIRGSWVSWALLCVKQNRSHNGLSYELTLDQQKQEDKGQPQFVISLFGLL